MVHDAERQHRRSIRLAGYDYSQAGAYFVTGCARGKECIFGKIVDEKMVLNDAGRMVEQCWRAIPAHFPHVELDAFVVMPNHFHGILIIVHTDVGAKDFSPVQMENVGAHNFSPVRMENAGAKDFSPQQTNVLPQPPGQRPHGTSQTIGSIIRGFKIGVTKWMRRHTNIHDVWQRNYYEHIIRDEESLNGIREYIVNNPLQWALDRENPAVAAKNVGAKDVSPLRTGNSGAKDFSPHQTTNVSPGRIENSGAKDVSPVRMEDVGAKDVSPVRTENTGNEPWRI